MPTRDYDLVSGLTGWGVSLSLLGPNPRVEAALDRILDTLAALLVRQDGIFPLHTGPQLLQGRMKANAPLGLVDCGAAHGVSGVVAMLSVLAATDSARLGRIRPALNDAATWLADLVEPGADGCLPPARMGLCGEREVPTRPEDVPTAWCYGGAGMARAVWLAGQALDDPALTTGAVAALRDAHLPSRHRLVGTSLCHGLAGLLLITWLLARDSGDPGLRHTAGKLLEQLLDRYEPDSLLGFRSIESGTEIDNPGLINGTSGILVVLTALLSNRDPSWIRITAVG
jgi:lantibiotic modifying enzyme